MCAIAKAGCILPSINMRTDEGPMAEVAQLARDCVTRGGLLDATVFGGFTYGDVAHAGASAMALANGDRAAAEAAAKLLAAAIAERREDFFLTLPTPREGLTMALAAAPGLVAVLDGADNPFSGGIADTPALFAALLAARPEAPLGRIRWTDPEVVDVGAPPAAGRDAARRLYLRGLPHEARGVGELQRGLPLGTAAREPALQVDAHAAGRGRRDRYLALRAVGLGRERQNREVVAVAAREVGAPLLAGAALDGDDRGRAPVDAET